MALLRKTVSLVIHSLLGRHPNNTAFSYNWTYVRANRSWFLKHAALLTGKAVDLGCGLCPYFPFVKEKITSYHGYDFGLLQRAGLPSDPKLFLGNLSLEGTVPELDETFDCLISNQVFYAVYQTEAYLREAHRLLKPGGLIFLTDAFTQPLMTDPYDYQRCTPNRFKRDLERHGFRLKAYEVSGYFFSGMAMSLSMILVLNKNFGFDSVARVQFSRQLIFAPLIFLLNMIAVFLDALFPFPRFPANMLFLAVKEPGKA